MFVYVYLCTYGRKRRMGNWKNRMGKSEGRGVTICESVDETIRLFN